MSANILANILLPWPVGVKHSTKAKFLGNMPPPASPLPPAPSLLSPLGPSPEAQGTCPLPQLHSAIRSALAHRCLRSEHRADFPQTLVGRAAGSSPRAEIQFSSALLSLGAGIKPERIAGAYCTFVGRRMGEGGRTALPPPPPSALNRSARR